jgi:hypothetical protein
MQPVLSICICALQSRIGMLGALRRELESQIERCNAQELVEVIINMDNKEKSTGQKRQELLEQAIGKYVASIDDDDMVSVSYMYEVLRACAMDCDVIAIEGWIETNGKNRIDWRTSKDYDNITIWEGGKKIYIRTVNHICPVRREIALQVGFPYISNAEDKAYSDGIRPLLKSEYRIDKQLYFYKFSTLNKEYK